MPADSATRPDAPIPERDARTSAPLRFPAYRWYLLAMIAALLANEFQTVAIWLQLYESTGDPLSLGLIGLAGLIPFASTVLIAGHVADAYDRRVVTLWALTALIGCTGTLAGLSLAGVVRNHVWIIYGVVAASGIARSFLNPARGALGAELVPPTMLEQGARLRSSVFQLGLGVGRSLSGFIYTLGASLGLVATFSYGVATVLLIAALFATMAIRRPPRMQLPTVEPMLLKLTSGVRFVLGSRILFGAMLLDLLGVLFGDAIILLPFFADRVLHVGPEGLGLLRAAPTAGAVLMALVLARRSTFAHAGRTLLLAVAAFGVAQAGFALSTSFAVSAFFLLCSGALDFISVMVRGALVQVLTPSHLLGRVTAVGQVFIWSSNELGAVEAGAAARLLGLVPSVVVGGLVTVAVTGMTAWLNPALRRLQRIAPGVAGHEPPPGAGAAFPSAGAGPPPPA
jgi:MFS family permease